MGASHRRAAHLLASRCAAAPRGHRGSTASPWTALIACPNRTLEMRRRAPPRRACMAPLPRAT
uniref:Uncharacterized protein n=1 Tax=Arundo donax TaxID=35708 RepID=A0A0A9AMU5_ARUDO